jgi:hypothetical protein
MRLRRVLALLPLLLALPLAAAPSFAYAVPDTVITLQRKACEKRCAVYKVMIFGDGTVIYDGEYFVRRPGLVKSSISTPVLTQLVSDLEAGGFFDLTGDYRPGNKEQCESVVSDGPIAILSVSAGGRSRTIVHDHRCVGAVASRITEMEDKVDSAVGTVHWIK